MREFSYQLYSSRNFPPLAETLRMLAEMGYAQVEGYGALFDAEDNVEKLSNALAETGLTMPSAHFGLDLLAEPERALRIAKTLGVQMVFGPHLAEEERPSDLAGWADFGKRLASLGAPLWEAGLSFGWHNHDFEFRALEGGLPIDALLSADPRLKLELDVAWVVRAGADGKEALIKYADRVAAIHIKDIAPEGQNASEDGWADVGQGVVGWTDLMPLAEDTAAELFIMEHDNPSDHRRFAQTSLDFFKG